MLGSVRRALARLGPGKRFNRDVGALGERLALRHLLRQGHRPLARNWRSRAGEIDLITALPDGTIVFTEVKTRRGEAFGEPLEAVDGEKRDRLLRLAADYLARGRMERRPVRFDLIGVRFGPRGEPEIEHLQEVF